MNTPRFPKHPLTTVAELAMLSLSVLVSTGCSSSTERSLDTTGERPGSLAEKASACRPGPGPQARQLDRRTRLYVPPEGPAAQQADRYREAGELEKAALMDAMAAEPQVVYLAVGDLDEMQERVRTTIRQARRQHQLPVFAAYDIPGRDCSQYSGGGANTEPEYRTWIDALAAAIGRNHAVVLIEPDGVALLPSEPWCGVAGGGFTGEPEDLERVRERFRELRYAVGRLGSLPQVDVYLDAGHSAWHPFNDYDAYYGEPQLQFGIVHRLLLAGVGHAAGFFLNPSNNRSTEKLITYGARIAKCVALLQSDPDFVLPEIYAPDVVYDEEGRFSSPCPPEEELDAMPLTPRAARRMPHFVIDTSRNGQGPWNLGDADTTNDDGVAFAEIYGYETTDPEIWCNTPGRGVGPRPTTRTGHPLVDAFLWIKVPGESDGQCGRNLVAPDPSWPANYDVAWDQVDPPAGQWFEAQALELARLADPPLLP